MEGVPSSRDYNGGFASKLMVTNWALTQLTYVCLKRVVLSHLSYWAKAWEVQDLFSLVHNFFLRAFAISNLLAVHLHLFTIFTLFLVVHCIFHVSLFFETYCWTLFAQKYTKLTIRSVGFFFSFKNKVVSTLNVNCEVYFSLIYFC